MSLTCRDTLAGGLPSPPSFPSLYWRVINWLNFNIVAFKGKGRPEDTEREGEEPICGAVRAHTAFASYVCRLPWLWFVGPKTITIVTSEITDHRST